MVQTILIYLINDEFDIDEYEREQLVIDHFPMHEYNERSVIWKFWQKNWWSVLTHPLRPSTDLKALIPQNQIALYHGVKTGFYFGFQANLVSLFIPLMIIATVFFIIGLMSKHGFNNEISPFFNIVIAIWSTIFIEKWKQRRSELAYFWDMHKVTEKNQIQRNEFTGITVIDKNTLEATKVDFKPEWKRFGWEVPLVIFGIGASVGVFIPIIYYTNTIEKEFNEGKITANQNTFFNVLIGGVNGVIIVVLELIYEILSTMVIRYENHKYQNEYIDRYNYVNFIFKFVNNYVFLFYYAFIKGDFEQISSQVLSLVASKQFLSTLKANIIPGILFKLKRRTFYKEWNKYRSEKKSQFLDEHNMKGKTWEQLANEN